MLIFMDTSSLVKRYIDENGTSDVDAYFQSKNNIFISAITPVEIHSTFQRKVNEKSLDYEAYSNANMSWEMEKRFFDIVRFDDRLTECAIMTLKSKGLRALDSIQLASAILVVCDEFVVSDKKLYKAAKEILPGAVTFIE